MSVASVFLEISHLFWSACVVFCLFWSMCVVFLSVLECVFVLSVCLFYRMRGHYSTYSGITGGALRRAFRKQRIGRQNIQ